ncbi:MAG: hypothetical protein ACI9G1_004689, partial [Pirellulaceae bacterium]
LAPVMVESDRPDPIEIPVDEVVIDDPINNPTTIQEFDETRAFVIPELEPEFVVFKLTEDGDILVENGEKVQWKQKKEPTQDNIDDVIKDFKMNAEDGLYSIHITYKSGDVKEIQFRVSSDDADEAAFIPRIYELPTAQLAVGDNTNSDDQANEVWQQWWLDQNPDQVLPVELSVVPAADDIAATNNIATTESHLVDETVREPENDSSEKSGEKTTARQAAMLGLLAPVMWLFGRSRKTESKTTESSEASESTAHSAESADPAVSLSFSRRARRQRAQKRDAS